MTLYFVATLLLTTLSAIVLVDAGPPSPAVWALPLLPGLAWTVLRFSGRGRITAPTRSEAAHHQPLTHFALHSGLPLGQQRSQLVIGQKKRGLLGKVQIGGKAVHVFGQILPMFPVIGLRGSKRVADNRAHPFRKPAL